MTAAVPRPTPAPALRPVQLGAPAGLASRLAASVIDAVLVLLALLVAYLGIAAVLFLARPRHFTFPAPSAAVLVPIALATAVGYLATCWATTGRTYGDHVLGLRVGRRDGRTLPVGWALVRAAAYVLVPIGLAWVAVNRQHQSLQDLLLRTAVVYDWD